MQRACPPCDPAHTAGRMCRSVSELSRASGVARAADPGGSSAPRATRIVTVTEIVRAVDVVRRQAERESRCEAAHRHEILRTLYEVRRCVQVASNAMAQRQGTIKT